MAIKATIRHTPTIKVAGVTQLTSSSSQPPLELKNNPAALKINNMASLADVDASNAVNGGVLTYDANTATYVVRAIDNGTF